MLLDLKVICLGISSADDRDRKYTDILTFY
jgi:hypothetical protein